MGVAVSRSEHTVRNPVLRRNHLRRMEFVMTLDVSLVPARSIRRTDLVIAVRNLLGIPLFGVSAWSRKTP